MRALAQRPRFGDRFLRWWNCSRMSDPDRYARTVHHEPGNAEAGGSTGRAASGWPAPGDRGAGRPFGAGTVCRGGHQASATGSWRGAPTAAGFERCAGHGSAGWTAAFPAGQLKHGNQALAWTCRREGPVCAWPGGDPIASASPVNRRAGSAPGLSGSAEPGDLSDGDRIRAANHNPVTGPNCAGHWSTQGTF